MGSKKSKCQERENFEFRYCRNSKIRTGENRNSLFSPALERNWARSTSSSSLSCARHAAAEKRRKAQKIKIGSADDHRDRWMHTLTDQWIESSLCRRPTTALRRTEIRANKRNSGKWSIPFSKGGGIGKKNNRLVQTLMNYRSFGGRNVRSLFVRTISTCFLSNKIGKNCFLFYE